MKEYKLYVSCLICDSVRCDIHVDEMESVMESMRKTSLFPFFKSSAKLSPVSLAFTVVA